MALSEVVEATGAPTAAHRLDAGPLPVTPDRLLAGGLTVGEIAANLHRSKQTVSAQKVSAMRKLGLSNDAALFIYVQEHGLA